MDDVRAALAEMAAEPWAMDPVYLESVRFALLAGGDVAKLHPRREQVVRESPGGLAVIPIHGPMVQHGGAFWRMFGGASASAIGQAITDAAANPDIKSILLHVESPGGSVYGTQELGARIAAAAAIKPVVAHADSYAASAAYWAASQATEIVVSPGGDVGSVGVYSLHVDYSQALETAGVKATFVSAGKFKVENNPYQPLSDEGRASMQDRVDRAYRAFLEAVAAGRGRSVEQVEEKFGQGRLVTAEEAVRRGMADRVATFEETVARFIPTKSRGARAESWAARRDHEARLLDVSERQ